MNTRIVKCRLPVILAVAMMLGGPYENIGSYGSLGLNAVSHGQDHWTNPGGGLFDIGSNWNDGTAPQQAESSLFNLPGAYSVDWDQVTGNVENYSVTVDAGFVRLVSIDSGLGGGQYEYLLSGDATINNGSQLQLGFLTDSHRLTVFNALQVNEGTFRAINGSCADIGNLLGVGSSGFGSVFVEGKDTTLSVGDLVELGVSPSGSSSMFVSNGASVNVERLFKVGAGGTGLLVVDGGTVEANPAGRFHGLAIGQDSNGQVDISNGGRVVASNVELGAQAGIGTLTIDGKGSSCVAPRFFFHDGLIQLTNGATLTADLYCSPSIFQIDGITVISGTGSTLSTNTLDVSGMQLQIDSGGLACARVTPIDNGEVLVTDSGSSLINSFSILVGRFADGELIVENGGAVNSGKIYAGSDDGGAGSITVKDPGTFLVTNTLHLGSTKSTGPPGNLMLENGGTVDCLWFAMSGTVLDSSATVTGTGTFLLGVSGSISGGTLNILDGGSVNFSNFLSNSGTINIEGAIPVNLAAPEITNFGTIRLAADDAVVTGDVVNFDGVGNISIEDNTDALFDGNVEHSGNDFFTGPDAKTRISGTAIGNAPFTGTGPVIISGALSPGTKAEPIASISFEGDLELGFGATTFIEIGGDNNSMFDNIVIDGSLQIDSNSTISVSFLNGFVPNTGDQFLIYQAGLRTGMFSDLDEGAEVAVAGNVPLTITYTAGDGNDIALLAGPVRAETTNTLRGILLSGDVTDTFDSDDEFLKYYPSTITNPAEFPVSIVFTSHLPSDDPESLTITVEAQGNTPGLTQRIEVFNFITNTWHTVASLDTTVNIDDPISIDLFSGIPDYVEPGTARVLARLGWKNTAPVLFHPWKICIDQIVWETN